MSSNLDLFYASNAQGETNGDWSAVGTPPWSLGSPPTASDDAGGSAAYNDTISFDTTATVNSWGSAGGVLDMTGGSLTILSGTSLPDDGGGAVVDQGEIEIAASAALTLGTNAGPYQVYGFSTAGTVTIDSGATLNTGGTIGGTVGGGGTFEIENSTLTASLMVAALEIAGSVTLGVNESYAGAFSMNVNTAIQLNGYTLTLSGSSISLSQAVVGGGALDITGSAILSPTGTSFVAAEGVNQATVTFEDGGTITEVGNVSIGGELLIDANATYTMTTAATISSGGSFAIVNNGSFIDNSGGGTSTIAGGNGYTLTNTGMMTIDAGNTLEITGGVTLAGSGAINGPGTLEIGGQLTLGNNFTYAGVFAFAGQNSVELNGMTLTLSGGSNVLGGDSAFGNGGALLVTGTTTIASSGLQFVSSVANGATPALSTFEDDGTVDQAGNLSLQGTLQIDSGATYALTAATTISAGGSFTIVNNGAFVDNSGGGTSTIAGGNGYDLTNNGAMTIDAGNTLEITGGVTLAGSGAINGPGTLEIGGQLTLGNNLTYAGVFAFAGENSVELNAMTLTLSGDSNVLGGDSAFGNGGALLVTGTTTIASSGLQFVSSVANGATPALSTFEDDGTVDQVGTLSLHGTLKIDSGATYALTAATAITDGGGATIVVNGTLVDNSSGGISTIGGYPTVITNNGVVKAASGSLVFAGALGGSGVVDIGAGQSVTFEESVSSGQQVTFQGAGAKLVLAAGVALQSAIDSFVAGDSVDLSGVAYVSTDHVAYSGNSTAGTVTIDNSSGAAVASFAVSGDYDAANFSLGADASNDLLVSYVGATTRTVNNSDGTSYLYTYNPNPTVAETIATYSGPNATGTMVSDIVDNSNGTSLLYAYNPSSTVKETASQYSATNSTNGAPSGSQVSDVVDNSNGTCLVYAYNPTSTVTQTAQLWSATNASNGAPAGNEISDVVDNTNGTVLIYAYNPSSTVTLTAQLWSAENTANGAPAGNEVSEVVDNTDGTSILYAYNPSSTVTQTATFYSSTNSSTGAPTGTVTSETFDYVAGQQFNGQSVGSSITTYGSGGSSTTQYYSGPDGTGSPVGSPIASAATTAAPDAPGITITGSGQSINAGAAGETIQFASGASNDQLMLSAQGTDQILGFAPSAGDTLNLSGLFSAAGVNVGLSNFQLANYVSIENFNGSAEILFDPTGHGGGSVVATLVNGGGLVSQLQSLKAFTA